MDLKELLKKFYDAGIMAEATLEEKYSFEQTLADNSEALQLQQTGVVWQSEQFYCNQDDGEYNNNPCSKQCNFCKEAESFK